MTSAPTEPLPPALDTAKERAIAEASEEVYSLLEELVAELGPRVSGSEAELRAAGLLKERYDSLGYDAEIQNFVTRYFDFSKWSRTGGGNATVVVESPTETGFSGLPLTSTPNDARSSGPLLSLDLSEMDEMPEEGLEGKVVHILTGDVNLGDVQVIEGLQNRVNRLADAGAVAVVISRKLGEPSPYRPLYGVPSPIPALLLTKANGQQLAGLTGEGAEVVVSVQIEVEVLESQNVIAELKGAGDGIVVVGAHYDIVPTTVTGANDNASGTAVVLALAQALSEERLPFTLRFVSFGAEELGLYGSTHYVASISDAELRRMEAMLNFDVVGSGEYTAVSGHMDLTEGALKLAGELQLQAQAGSLPYGASSDHSPFERAGVPALLVWAPDISRIHSPADTLEFVQPERLGEAFLLAEALLASTEFPPQ